MAPKLRLLAPRPTQLSQWERSLELGAGLDVLRRSQLFCDVQLQSSDGHLVLCHQVVLASCSEKLKKLMEQAKVPENGTQHASSDKIREAVTGATLPALSAVLDFIYAGQAQLCHAQVPELARLARRWELLSLQEALATVVASEEGGLTPEVVAGLFALGEPFGEQLGAAARSYVLGNFASCAMTEPFARWPQKVLEHLLKSDQLNVSSEEEALLWVTKWRAAKAGREETSVAILTAIRWPLMSLHSLETLSDMKPATPSSFADTVATRCKAAKVAHQGLETLPNVRQSFNGWWAGLGCAAKGGVIMAGQGCPGSKEAIKVKAVRPHEGTLLLLDASEEPGRVLQWFLRMHSGRSVAGKGSELDMTFEDMADIWSGPDDAFYILDRDAERVVQVRQGEAELVNQGTIRLERPCSVAVEGPDRAIYVLDREGSRVVRYVRGRAVQVAGGTEAGSGAAQLNAGPTGRIYAAKGGRLYISDTGNHRVQRWDPGAKVGITVAGGHGCGSGADQLSHPGGIWALDNGTVYVADVGNHRVMKWRDGAKAGVLAAGGYGPGDALHQLKEPVDVMVDATGALIVADLGNARLVRWAAPQVPTELLQALRG
ncbi:unnamed protein product [Cladocopium goreaui]|uniref:Kelch-like protein 28 (BTB/POZ domain-containing protein 5) n=1 Tax=Cladocopium goreaui TaxID=2562237 RepID=A0A9P1D795_9DINO|nr:unnamed protein product [Cladocopium goreaui]